MKPRRDIRQVQTATLADRPPTSKELLAWYRERDGDAGDLHRRYVRAKYGMRQWSDADLSRYHQYRRSVSRERAAQLVIARGYAIRGLTVAALAAAIGGLLYAAAEWWRRKAAKPALPAAPKSKTKPEVPSSAERKDDKS
jgi:hypothetical protein